MGNACCAPHNSGQQTTDIKMRRSTGKKSIVKQTDGSRRSETKSNGKQVIQSQMDYYKNGEDQGATMQEESRRSVQSSKEGRLTLENRLTDPSAAQQAADNVRSTTAMAMRANSIESVDFQRLGQNRTQSVMLGQYTTEQSFTEGPMTVADSDTSFDRLNNTLKFGTRLQTGSLHHQRISQRVYDEEIDEIKRVTDVEEPNSNLVAKENHGPQDVPPLYSHLEENELKLGEEELRFQTEGNGYNDRHSLLDQIDELMSRDERSNTQHKHTVVESHMNGDQYLEDVDYKQSFFGKMSQSKRKDSSTLQSRSTVNKNYLDQSVLPESRVTMPSHQTPHLGLDPQEQSARITFQGQNYKDLVNMVEEKLQQQQERFSQPISRPSKLGVKASFHQKKPSHAVIGNQRPFEDDEELDGLDDDFKRSQLQEDTQFENFAVEEFDQFAENAGLVETDQAIGEAYLSSEDNLEGQERDITLDYEESKSSQSLQSYQQEGDELRSDMESESSSSNSSSNSSDVRRLVTEDRNEANESSNDGELGNSLFNVGKVGNMTVDQMDMRSDDNEQSFTNNLRESKAHNKSGILSPTALRDRSLLGKMSKDDKISDLGLKKSGLRPPSQTRTPQQSKVMPQLNLTFKKQQTLATPKQGLITRQGATTTSASRRLSMLNTIQAKPLTPKVITPRFHQSIKNTPEVAKRLLPPTTPLADKKVAQNKSFSQMKLQISPTIGQRRTSVIPASPASSSQLNLSMESPMTLNTASQGFFRLSTDMQNVSSNERDQISDMLEAYIIRNKVKVPVARLEGNKYLFGTKVIIASIVNESLKVRVGGGFMTIEDFVKQHQQNEIFKLRTLCAQQKKKVQKVMADLTEKYMPKKVFIQ